MIEFFTQSVAHPTPMSFASLAAALLVVVGGVWGTYQSFQDPKSNVALVYGGAGLIAIVGLLAFGQGAYAVDMMAANAEALRMAGPERAGHVVQASAHAQASLAFAGLGAAVALVIATGLLFRALYLRGDNRLPEGVRDSIHSLDSTRKSRIAA